jgi:hypothetical protein
MADDYKDPKKLFDPQNISEANSAIRALADNAANLKKVSEEFGDSFGRSLVNNINQVSRDFDKVAGQASDFYKLEVSKSEALRLEKKLRLDLNKLQNEESGLRDRVEGTLKKSADKSQEIYEAAKANLENLTASGQSTKKQLENAEARAEAAKKIRDYNSEAYDLGKSALENLEESVARGRELEEGAAQYAANFNKAKVASGLLGRTLKGLKKIPIVGDIIDADTMLSVMNKNLIKGDGLFKAFGKGVSAAFKGIEKSTIILAVISAVAKALKFVVSLATAAQGQTIAIARGLGLSGKNAENLRSSFDNLKDSSGNLLINVDSATKAALGFQKNLGFTTNQSEDLVKSQVFLTENLKLSGEQSSKLGLIMASTGQSSEELLENTNNINNEIASATGRLIPFDQLMNKVAEAGAEISSYFGDSVVALAEGVRKVSAFGLGLKDALSVTKSLLDFESSINNELNAELLLGKDLNFEKARSLAMQGKIADATENVLSQFQDLTEEQRRSPIYLEAAAQAAGVSAEQLAQSFQTQKYLNLSAKEYADLQARAAKTGNADLIESAQLRGRNTDEIKNQLTISEALQAATIRIKDAFASLIDQGVLTKITDGIVDFMNNADKVVGTVKTIGLVFDALVIKPLLAAGRLVAGMVKGIASIGKFLIGDFSGAKESARSGGEDIVKGLANAVDAGTNLIVAATGEGESNYFSKRANKSIDAEDFTINTHPKDTLVMAGGTKLGGDQEAVIAELKTLNKGIDDIRSREGNVYIDGNPTGMALGMQVYRTS